MSRRPMNGYKEACVKPVSEPATPVPAAQPPRMSPLTIPLNDGNRIPWLGFGTGTALLRKDATEAIRNAIAHGVVHLDGAQLYENEDSLGAGIAASGKPRSELFVTTKVLELPEGVTVRDKLMESLKKLGTDYVDLFLLHSPVHLAGKVRSAWKELEELQKEGLVRSIGVSNFRVEDLEDLLEVATVVPAVNQIEYHPYVFKASQPLLEFHKKHNIVTTSYGGMAPLVHHKGGPVDPVLASVRERLEKETGREVTAGQVLGLWLRAQGIPQITTSSKLERVKEYLATETLPDLTPEEVHAINEAGSQVHVRVLCKWMDE
ncbi:Aldo/keto reductase [Trametes cingulata]|nr:Aldo/keto reductase [Trametes cingulata]